MTARAELWGAEHLGLGEIGIVSPAPHTAIALSYGGHPKHYPRDSLVNEDAVAAVVGTRATLLVLADGHCGYESVPPSVGTVLERLGDDPPPADLSDAALVELFLAANQAVIEVTGGPLGPSAASRTTLIVALIAGNRLQWASFGDSEIFGVDAGFARSLGEPKLKFIGYPMDRDGVAALLDRGYEELAPGAAVLAASDGLTDYLDGDAGQLIADELARETTPAEHVETLVRTAFRGGAGDNVGIALTAVGGTPRPGAAG